jgi:hypothetical protein
MTEGVLLISVAGSFHIKNPPLMFSLTCAKWKKGKEKKKEKEKRT